MATVAQYVTNFTSLNPLFKDQPTPEVQMKALMLGDYNVGMTCLAVRVNFVIDAALTLNLQFQKDAWLIGPSSDKYWGVGWTHRLQLRDKHIALELLVDCPAPKVSVEEWPSGLARPYSQARHYEAFFLVYDITSRASFEAVKAYQQNIVRERAISRSDCPECFRVECPPRPSFQGLTFVFANKIDRDQSQWQVSLEEGRQFADSIATSAESHATYFLPMSVKTGKGCSRADGEGIARRIILRRTQSPPFAHGRARHVETERVLSKREGPLHAYEDGWLYWY